MLKSLFTVISIAILLGLVIFLSIKLATIFLFNDNDLHIPKVIWTYWEGDIPLSVHLCMDSWRKYNPEYKVIMLNDHNLRRYVDFDFSTLKHAKESPARFSDFVRLIMLAHHGGIWMDASIICRAPIDPLLSSQYEMVGFYLDGFTTIQSSKVIESWFIACPRHSPFVKAWATEFLRTNEFDRIDDYLDDVKRSTDFQKIFNPNYLCIHVSAQKVLQSPNNYKLLLHKAEDIPYKYLVDVDWDSEKAVQSLQHSSSYQSIPLLKLRSIERKELVAQSDHTLFFPHVLSNKTDTAIPSIIWTYWDGDLPILNHLCIDSWRKHNPTYEIVIVTKSTLHKYISTEFHHDNQSLDHVKLHVLARHGGIWLDPTFVCYDSFEWLHKLQKKHKFQVLAYTQCLGTCDEIDAAFIACTPGCPFLIAWRDEFMKITDINDSYSMVIRTHPEFNKFVYLLDGNKAMSEDKRIMRPLINLSNSDKQNSDVFQLFDN